MTCGWISCCSFLSTTFLSTASASSSSLIEVEVRTDVSRASLAGMAEVMAAMVAASSR